MKKTRIAAFLLIAALLLTNPCAAAFSDTTGHWASTEIARAQNLGFVSGKGNDVFDPDSPATRAEFVAILNRAFLEALHDSGETPVFSDVRETDWYYADIVAAARSELVSCEGEVFNPQSGITRQDAAVMLAGYITACGFELRSTFESSPFSDSADIGEYAKEAVSALAALRIIKGYPDGSFCPLGTLTRAESVALVNSAYKLLHPNLPSMNDYFDRLDGSTVTQPLSAAIMAGQLDIDRKQANALVTHNKTDAAIRNVIDGAKDLALVTYPSDETLAYAQECGVGLTIVPIVNEAFVFMVNKDNPVQSLTVQQVKDIYSGKITNWKQVGGNDAAIVPLQRNADSGSQNGMLDFMGDTKIMVPFEDALVEWAMGLLIERVDDEPDAIGYSYYYYTTNMYLSDTRLLSINGVAPSNTNISNLTYPITTQYYTLFRNTEPWDGFARTVTEYILSAEGQDIAEKEGYVKLGLNQIKPLPVPAEGAQSVQYPERPFTLDEVFRSLAADHYAGNLPKRFISELYSKSAPAVVKAHNSDDTVKAVIDGSAELALGAHPTQEILLYAAERGVELEIIPIVQERLVFLTGTKNPMNSLSKAQLAVAFEKRVTNWSELGGEDKKIELFGQSDRFLSAFLGVDKVDGDMKMDIEGWDGRPSYPAGYWAFDLGYDFYTQINYDGKILEVGGVSYKDSAYPAKMTYYAVLRKSAGEGSFARRFVEFALSDEGQKLAAELGYLGVE